MPVCQPAPLIVVEAAAAAPLIPEPFSTSTVIVFQAGAFGWFFVPPLVLSGVPELLAVVGPDDCFEVGVADEVVSLPEPATENAQISPSNATANPPTARIRVFTPRGTFDGIPCDSSRLANQSSRRCSSSACSGAASGLRSCLVSRRAITRGNDTRDTNLPGGYDPADGARGNRPVGGRGPCGRRRSGRRTPWRSRPGAPLR